MWLSCMWYVIWRCLLLFFMLYLGRGCLFEERIEDLRIKGKLYI